MNKVDISRGNLLLEFFSEEIPARMQLNSEKQLQNLFIKSLTQRDMAFESGAQMLSTDYPIRNLSHSLDYFVSFEDNIKVRCNPKVNLNHCRLIDLKE